MGVKDKAGNRWAEGSPANARWSGNPWGEVITSFDQNEQTTWPDSLDTARDCSFMNDQEKAVVFELNKVRWDPVLYGKQVIAPGRALYQGKLVKMAGKYSRSSKEGVAALEECLMALEKSKSEGTRELVYPFEPFYRSALDHSEDQSKNGGMGHGGSKGDQASDRILRYAKRHPWEYSNAEEGIAYGSWCNLAKWVIFQLLIDDGVLSRVHRHQILMKDWRQVGVSIKTHPSQGFVCTIVFGLGMLPLEK